MGALSEERRADSSKSGGERRAGTPVAAPSAPLRQAARMSPAALQRTVGNRGVLARLRQGGGGHPLDSGTRQRMEGVLRQDFSRVRVHTGAAGATLAGRLSTRAVTIGEDVAFAPGQYRPGTPVGDAMLAHELAHVVQQRGAPEEASQDLAPEPAGSPLEREAERAAVGTVAALWAADRRGARPFVERARPTLKSQRRFQRCGYTAERPPHTFKSCGFSASGDGPLKVDPTDVAVKVTSPTFCASGEVAISGGSDDQAQGWQAGFVQTVLASQRRGDYFNASGVHDHYIEASIPGPRRDALSDATSLPWYADADLAPFPGKESTVETQIDDTPEITLPWRFAGQRLVATEGKDEFCAWLAVGQKSTSPDPVYLNWAKWEIDWATELDPNAKTGRATTGRMKVVKTGDGRGAETPVTGGERAEKSLSKPRWVP